MKKQKQRSRSKRSSAGSQESEHREEENAACVDCVEEEKGGVEYCLRTKTTRSPSQLTITVRT